MTNNIEYLKLQQQICTIVEIGEKIGKALFKLNLLKYLFLHNIDFIITFY